jgi:hypothetical protein
MPIWHVGATAAGHGVTQGARLKQKNAARSARSRPRSSRTQFPGRLPAIATSSTAATAASTAPAAAFAVVTTTAAAAAAVVTAAAAAAVATTAAATAITTAATVATTAAVATAATAAEATAAAAAATTALLALLGFVDAERPTVESATIHALDRLGGFLGGTHGHEGKAAGAAGLSIGDQVDIAYRSEFLERRTDALSVGIER